MDKKHKGQTIIIDELITVSKLCNRKKSVHFLNKQQIKGGQLVY